MRVIDRCHHQHIKSFLLEHLLKILLSTKSQIIPSLFFQHIRNYKISNLQQHISWLRACRLLEASCYANPFVHRWYHKALPDWCLHDWPLLSCRAFHFPQLFVTLVARKGHHGIKTYPGSMARPDDADPPRKLACSLITVDCSHDVFTDH